MTGIMDLLRIKMPRGPKGEKRPAGLVECAHEVFQIAIGEKEDEAPSGKRRSGLAGAKARVQATTLEERKNIAALAARKRWEKK